jgi:hypothetical protein
MWWFSRDRSASKAATQALERESGTHAELMELAREAARLSEQLAFLPDIERQRTRGAHNE